MPNMFEEILESTDSHLCVIAAPGSGKTTKILLPKIQQLLASGIDPSRILLLTFSRISAIDLKRKLASHPPQLRAATVHSIALSFLLSENNHAIRDRIECILIGFEKEVLLSDLQTVLTGVGRRNLRKQLKEFSAGWATEPHNEVFEEDDAQRRFKHAVVRWLTEHQASMMEEIVYHAVDLGRQLGHAPFIDEPQYICVDEFQDLNKLEQEFIRLFSANSKLLLVVGDPDQSIYSFKYAHPRGIEAFAAEAGVTPYRCAVTLRCPRTITAFAAQLLEQSAPGRGNLIEPQKEAREGEIHFIQKNTQEEEFEFVLSSISQRLQSGVSPIDIIVLVPRKKFGEDFGRYATEHKITRKIEERVKFEFVLRPEFDEEEQKSILLLGLLAKPNSLLYPRVYIGLGDEHHFANELRVLKEHYGGVSQVFQNALAEDFPTRSRRIHTVCSRIEELRRFLASHHNALNVNEVLEELFPTANANLSKLRSMFDALRENGDSIQELYGKFVDYVRTIPTDESTVRTMTLMASKGLGADHVYIMGVNAGNIPGENRSEQLSSQEHIDEQRRLLYVGFTRSQQTLTVSWSRHIPFHQSRSQYTSSLRTVTIGGTRYSEVGLSEFLQSMRGIRWEY